LKQAHIVTSLQIVREDPISVREEAVRPYD